MSLLFEHGRNQITPHLRPSLFVTEMVGPLGFWGIDVKLALIDDSAANWIIKRPRNFSLELHRVGVDVQEARSVCEDELPLFGKETFALEREAGEDLVLADVEKRAPLGLWWAGRG